jgi:hypothetical protein
LAELLGATKNLFKIESQISNLEFEKFEKTIIPDLFDK